MVCGSQGKMRTTKEKTFQKVGFIFQLLKKVTELSC